MRKSSGGRGGWRVSIPHIKRKYWERQNGPGVVFTTWPEPQISFLLFFPKRREIASDCLHCVGPLRHFQAQDKDQEHLSAAGELLRPWFCLWEVNIDFLPLVTLKSPPRPFRHTLTDSGSGIKGLGRHSCREASGGPCRGL